MSNQALETYLQLVRERLEKATPGPWKILMKGSGPYIGNWDVKQKMAACDYFDDINICRVDQYNLPIKEKHCAESNAHLIAHAPTDIATLLRMLEKAIQQRDNLIYYAPERLTTETRQIVIDAANSELIAIVESTKNE